MSQCVTETLFLGAVKESFFFLMEEFLKAIMRLSTVICISRTKGAKPSTDPSLSVSVESDLIPAALLSTPALSQLSSFSTRQVRTLKLMTRFSDSCRLAKTRRDPLLISSRLLSRNNYCGTLLVDTAVRNECTLTRPIKPWRIHLTMLLLLLE